VRRRGTQPSSTGCTGLPRGIRPFARRALFLSKLMFAFRLFDGDRNVIRRSRSADRRCRQRVRCRDVLVLSSDSQKWTFRCPKQLIGAATFLHAAPRSLFVNSGSGWPCDTVSDTISYAINQLSATAFDVANAVGDKTNPSKHLNSPQSSRADHSSTIRQNTFQSSFNSIAFARGS